ncbi:pilus assembly protein TadG-related protein [Burkholderia gladioli]
MNSAQSRSAGTFTGKSSIAGRRRERGSFAVMAAVFLVVIAAIFGVLDVGNTYLQRRDLQQIADMAAAAGVQRVQICAPRRRPAPPTAPPSTA